MKKNNTINLFTGQYAFLSNFYPIIFEYENKLWPSVEHAFQAMKIIRPEAQEHIRLANSCRDAKRMGQCVKLRKDWEQQKVQIMAAILHAKFSIPELQDLLIKTEPKILIEGNYWHDNYWGSCTCLKCRFKRKINMLGHLLMAERKMLLEIQ